MQVSADDESGTEGRGAQAGAARGLLARRVASVGLSVFSEMTALARQHRAVNLGQGYPDFAGPDWVKEAARDAIARDVNQYALSEGSLRLRQQVAAMAGPRLGRGLDPELEVTITSGATEGVFAAMQALVEPGDSVAVFDPAYESYGPAITYPGGVTRCVPLYAPDAHHASWWFDGEELRRVLRSGARVLLLNTPHNPTGKVFTRAELSVIAALCQEYDVLAVTDEVYEYLTFGVQHVSLASLPGMWERTLTVSSSAKTFSLTGWKIGWAVGPAHLVRGLAAAHQSMVFCAAAPLQEGIAEGLAQAEARGYYQLLQAEYQQRRDYLLAALHEVGLPPYPTEGSYFTLCDIRGLGYADDWAFCRALTVEAGVTAIPPTAFYSPENRHLGQQMARFAFCKRMETLEEAARRLAAWHRRHR
jgi:aspartate/methionine/tyrosine aminotransferase